MNEKGKSGDNIKKGKRRRKKGKMQYGINERESECGVGC
jgi:hypothetical protein